MAGRDIQEPCNVKKVSTKFLLTRLWRSWKYRDTVHSMVCPESSISGNVYEKWERHTRIWMYLMACRSSSHVANSVLSSHLATMGDFNFESLDFFGEFYTLRVSKASRLAKFISWSIEHFAHEVNDRLCSIESSSRYINVQHHLPLARAHTLMESKPDFSAASKWWSLSNRSWEEWPSDWSISHRW